MLPSILSLEKRYSAYSKISLGYLVISGNPPFPHPEVLSDRWITNSERAKKMSQWRSRFPPIPVSDILIKPQHVASAIQSIHIHINGKTPYDVLHKFNRLLCMSPELIALSANSPIIGGKLVDYAEVRLLLYEMADGGKGGFPDITRYPRDILEYAEIGRAHV